MRKYNRQFLYLTCFITGSVVLILEILGFRLFAPYFGNSVYVSGGLIGIILAALSIGYFIGGRISDRYPKEQLVYAFILFSAVYLFFIYIYKVPLLKILQKTGFIYGSLLASVVFFWIPMVLLSIVSPFLVRLLGSANDLGSVAGNIYAFSTAGSILGSFLTTFYLIPHFGSSKTLALCIGTLIVISTSGLYFSNKKCIFFGFFLFLLLIPPRTSAEKNLIFETESSYNTIRIYQDDKFRWMVLNDPFWKQSYIPINGKIYDSYQEYFALAPLITDVSDVLVLGMSAGASIKDMNKYFDIYIDAVEIDPVVIQLADEYFDVKEGPRLNIYAEDARTLISRTEKKYDFIEIDLFQGGPEIPYYVASMEFFSDVKDHLSDNGIMMMNVLGDAQDNNMLVKPISNTLTRLFSNVYVSNLSDNTLVIAGNIRLAQIQENLNQVKGEQKYYAQKFLQGLKEYKFDEQFCIFTDDLSPIEFYTFKVISAIRGYPGDIRHVHK